MKMRLIGLLVVLLLVFFPTGTVGASTTANVTVNATPAFISISVNNATYSFGVVSTSTNYSTVQGYFVITNGSTVQTDNTIGVLNATWIGGVAWTHSDTGTPGADTIAMYSTNDTTAWNIIVKQYKNSPNYIYENLPASTNFKFGLRIMTPTSFTDGIIKVNEVTVMSAAG